MYYTQARPGKVSVLRRARKKTLEKGKWSKKRTRVGKGGAQDDEEELA